MMMTVMIDDCMCVILHRVPLVPMFAFGENDLYQQVANPVGSRLRRFQTLMTKVLTFSLPLFYGRGLFNYTFGFLPFRHPVSVVGQYVFS